MAKTETGSAGTARPSRAYALPAVLAIGFAVRLAHLLALRASPLWNVLQWDAKTYNDWALDVAGGAWIGERAFWQDPLYAYVLGALYRLFGHDLWIPRLFALACGVTSAWLVARIAERVWGSRGVALAAALGFGLYLPAIHYEAIVGKTALSMLLLALATERLLAWTDRALLASGIALGLGVLTRGNLLLLLPLGALAIACDWLETGARRERPLLTRRAGRFCAGALAVIALATLHNFLAVQKFVPLTTNLGINLYLGNHPDNPHGYYTPPPFLAANAFTEIPAFREEAERRGAGELDDNQLSSYWTGQTLRSAGAAPGHLLGLWFDKARLLLSADEVADADSIDLVAEFSPVLRWPGLRWGQLLPFALLGAVVAFRQRAVRVTALAALAYGASLMPFFMLGRLRATLVPLALVLAAGGASWLLEALRKRERRALTHALPIVLASLTACYLRPAWMEETQVVAGAVNWNNLGAALAESGATDDAIHAYARAVALDAHAVPVALRALANMHEQRGELPAALGALDQLVEIKPDSASAQAALRRVRAALLGNTNGSTTAAAPLAPLAPLADWSLSDSARSALIARLSQEQPGARLYLRFDGRDAGARDFARALSSAASDAGWQVALQGEADFPLKPGLFLFAAGAATASYSALEDALERAGFSPHAGTDYRSFIADKQREDPAYRGVSFADGQDYVLCVGRAP